MFEVRSLAFSYPHRNVLKDISFVVSPGEVVSVIGANGAGKTTLLKILATLAVPSSGLVLSDGINAFERPLKYRRQVGYLPEKPALYDDMTVKDYLTYRATLKGEPAKRVRRRVSEASELCRLSDLMKCGTRRLSLGQTKRVALADALLLRPRVLLLDDFLAGLDAEMRAASGAILSEAGAFSSVIVTGHELADFATWTTRSIVLSGGVVSATISAVGASHEDFVANMRAALKGGVA